MILLKNKNMICLKELLQSEKLVRKKLILKRHVKQKKLLKRKKLIKLINKLVNMISNKVFLLFSAHIT